jgi:hypothetical protein
LREAGVTRTQALAHARLVAFVHRSNEDRSAALVEIVANPGAAHPLRNGFLLDLTQRDGDPWTVHQVGYQP